MRPRILTSRTSGGQREELSFEPDVQRKMQRPSTSSKLWKSCARSPPAAEPEFYETEVTLDTGATVHAADRMSFPGHEVKEGAGSRAGQRFQCAGNKMIDNEGEMFVTMFAPGCGDGALLSCFQAAKVTRPLLSVTKLTDSGQLHVICKKEEALVIDSQQRVLAIFKRNGGLYTAKMKVKNPRFQPFHRQE